MRLPSPSEPVTELRRIPIVECGEPLASFLGMGERIVQDRPVFAYTRATMARKTVVQMLSRAADALPPGYRLGIIEGWRPAYIQRRMYLAVWRWFEGRNPDWSHTKLRRVVNRFTAPLDARVPPPHTTGGAVDVRLLNEEGEQCDCRSPFEPFDTAAYPMNAKGLSQLARENRMILARAMTEGGLTNYPSEYWHWSYGDQGWAYRGGHGHAIYGPVAPPEWQPVPEDQTDEPLAYAT